MPTPVKLPKLSKSQIASIDKQFDQATRALEKLGFEQGPTTKSRIFTLTYLTKNAKGYVSIRYSPDLDKSMVICELYARTKTKEPHLGFEVRIIDYTPRTNSVVFYNGLAVRNCRRDFIKYSEYLMLGIDIVTSMSKF